ncbi:MAG: hypothetical protein AAF492_11240, partial [Verrucomicrobiota bacterium]
MSESNWQERVERCRNDGLAALDVSELALEDWPDGLEKLEGVTKLVAGTLSTGEDSPDLTFSKLGPIPPALTHLHIWSATGLRRVDGDWPEGLLTLDVRGCKQLVPPAGLPAGLRWLDLGGCERWDVLPEAPPAQLERLWLNDCLALEEKEILAWMEACPELTHLDLSGCKQLTRLPVLPPKLKVLKLAGCEKLETLPETLPASLDHLDLSGTATLQSMPRPPDALRTLYLHSSGLKTPPKALHGEEGKSVAADVREYFRFERVEQNRCKLLLLGNGRAGKTTLAKWLVGEERKADEPSTHAVRLVEWSTSLKHPGRSKSRPATIQIWDFGGQDIYHNAHHMFLEGYCVFLIVWSAVGDESSEVDRPRSIQYWLDYVFSVRPDAQALLVCTQTDEAEKQGRNPRPDWVGQVEREMEGRVRCVYVDALHGTGEKAELDEWLGEALHGEIEAAGPSIPKIWD